MLTIRIQIRRFESENNNGKIYEAVFSHHPVPHFGRLLQGTGQGVLHKFVS
jgi:hypothetical protein